MKQERQVCKHSVCVFVGVLISLCLYCMCGHSRVCVWDCVWGLLRHILYDLITWDGLHRQWSRRHWSTQALHNKQRQQHEALTIPEREREREKHLKCMDLYPLCLCTVKWWICLYTVTSLNWILPWCVMQKWEKNISSSPCFCFMIVIRVVSCAPQVKITEDN